MLYLHIYTVIETEIDTQRLRTYWKLHKLTLNPFGPFSFSLIFYFWLFNLAICSTPFLDTH